MLMMANDLDLCKLIDSHGRRIRKLRISLLDACNFRCFYCMPLRPKFMSSDKYITPDEIETISSELVYHGVDQIRLTGGEPLLRREFREIVERLSVLPLKKLGLTTNGFYLERELPFLKGTNCRHLNISLDSLEKKNFDRITRTESFDRVFSSIMAAKEMGFQVKLNTVLMKGWNDHELEDFVEFSAKNDIEVRFLEVMKIGQVCQTQNDLFLSAGEALQQLRGKYQLKVQSVEKDSTSFNFVSEHGAKIGFIASESRPFCESCSRWRLSATGFLRACLMSEQGVNVRGVAADQIYDSVLPLLSMKPFQRIEKVTQDMNQIGG